MDVFGNRLFKKYDMEQYSPNNDKDVPVVFFGCYSGGVKRDIMNQRSLVVIVWSGGDGVRLHEDTGFIDYCKENKHRIFHIAHSHWLQTDLKFWGLDYIDRVVLPLIPELFKFEPDKGNQLYMYGPKERGWYYGRHIVDRLRFKWGGSKHFPKIVITEPRGYSHGELYEIYKKSFLGVRLTEHDNMALSCIELGLMGRKSIFNGNIPCAIPYGHEYNTYLSGTKREWVFQRDEIILPQVEKMILKEWREYTGPDRVVAEEMREFVHDDRKWLNTKFYE
jgi:hypothetical protein